MKTASIFGASGATGRELLQLLLADSTYIAVKSFGRRNLDVQHQKLEQITVDFTDLSQYKEQIQADDIFVCIGTTQKKAGSKANFRAIDYDIPVALAHLADKENLNTFVVISSIGASANSASFYLKTKGEMENSILKELGEKAKILRPSLLLGKRDEFRFSEELSKILFPLLSIFMIGKLSKYKAIHTKQVAIAMLNIANKTFENSIFESNKVSKIAIQNT